MGYSKETPTYHLPQYVADDRPSYLGDWNETMGIIDSGMKENKEGLITTNTSLANLSTRVDNMKEDTDKALKQSTEAIDIINGFEVTNLGDYIIVYVSITGNDTTGDGTSSAPFQSIDRAIAYCNEHLITNVQIDLLTSGTYNTSVNFIQSSQVHFNSAVAANINFTSTSRVSVYNCYLSFSSTSVLTVACESGMHVNASTLYALNTTFSIGSTFNFTGSNIKLEYCTLSNSVNIGCECCMLELLSCVLNTTSNDIIRGYGCFLLINGATFNGTNTAIYPIRFYGGVVSLTGTITNNIESLTGLVQGTRCAVTVDPSTWSGVSGTANIVGGQCVIASKTNGVHWVDA